MAHRTPSDYDPRMRAIWKGAISFGLVNIPVSLFPALRREELKFRLLRSSDLSPVNYKRVAEADGKEVPWDQIVKGYEHQKGKFVVLKDEDFARVDIEATQTVDIVNFVELKEVNPLLFHKPYYMEVSKGGEKAYALLREALLDVGKIGIAKVVLKTRQHLAAIKPQDKGLMLELMHFPEELLEPAEFKLPPARSVSRPELAMARELIASMTVPWKPADYEDEYHEKLEKIVAEKVKHPSAGTTTRARSPKPASNVIDLTEVLRQSLRETRGTKRKSSTKTGPADKPRGKKAA
jgi:DNA end-binding protein Ku